MNRTPLWTTIALMLLTAATSLADVPALIPVQGFLGNAEGVPIDDSNLTLQFKLFDSENATEAIWAETQLGVDVDEGVFSVYLGSVTAIDPSILIDAAELWLEMAVGAEVLGRIQVASVPFAVEAQQCKQVGDLSGDQIQSVITGTCEEGSAIRAISSDGTVTCETMRPIWKGDSVEAQSIDFVNMYHSSNSEIWPLFCVDIPKSGMMNVEVDISSHRSYGGWKASGLSRYQLYFSNNADGDANSELVREITGYRYQSFNADLSTESLGFTKSGDTYKFTIDRTGINPGDNVSMRTVVHVRGSGYDISNLVATCN